MSTEQDLQEIEKLLPGKIPELLKDHSKITAVKRDLETRYVRLDLESNHPGVEHPMYRSGFYEVLFDEEMRRLAQRQVYRYPHLGWVNPAYNATFYDDARLMLRNVWSEPIRLTLGNQTITVRKDDIAFQTRFGTSNSDDVLCSLLKILSSIKKQR